MATEAVFHSLVIQGQSQVLSVPVHLNEMVLTIVHSEFWSAEFKSAFTVSAIDDKVGHAIKHLYGDEVT